MRILFSTTAGAGHFGPLVPFARACQTAGHDVLVAAPASFAASIGAESLAHAPFADVPPEVMGPLFERFASMSMEEANTMVIGEVFGRLDAQAALAGVTATIETWHPDIVVREPCEFASWAAAEKAGVAQAVVAINIAATDEATLPMLFEPLAELRAIAGLDPDADLTGLQGLPCLTTVPLTFDGDAARPYGSVWRFRDPIDGDRAARLPAPWGDPDAPLVYATFGSITGTLPPFASMYRGAVDALAGMDARVFLTTGTVQQDLGTVPGNVHVERWWPQSDVMPVAAASVGHGGFGTTMLALASGVPQVVVPLFAMDQFLNGRRVADTGIGLCIEGGPDALGALRDAVERVLGEPAYAAAARQMAEEVAELPDVAEAVPILEKLATR